jgi:hypothetical protein
MKNFKTTLANFPISLEESDIICGFDEHPLISTFRCNLFHFIVSTDSNTNAILTPQLSQKQRKWNW